jgi:hypothetical protein
MTKTTNTISMSQQSIFSNRVAALGVLCCAILTLSGTVIHAQTTNGASRPDFSKFKIITDRNIFNPKRYPSRSGTTPRERGRSRPPTDAFTLVGTMSYEKGPFAFFEGNRSDFQKVLKPEEEIAGHKVVSIEPGGVTLDSGTNQVFLRVGHQMRRDEQAGWRLSDAPVSTNQPPPSFLSADSGPIRTVLPDGSSSTNETSELDGVLNDPAIQGLVADPQAEPGTTNNADALPDDPVLRKLMERRKQETDR